jgi:fibronectin type 3 domain-containing protein
MRKLLHSFATLSGFFLISFAALALLAWCGNPRTLFAQDKSNKPHSVTINWNRSASSVAGYNVYRADPGGAPAKLTGKIVADTRFIDRNVLAGHTYTYTITSVDFKGVESKPSSAITVTVPGTAASHAKQ